MAVIGISGHIGSGKDTVAKIIQWQTSGLTKISFEEYKERLDAFTPWIVVKYADKLKEIVALMLGVPRNALENEKFKNSLLPPRWQHFENGQLPNRTVRWLLQYVGTDLFRNQIHPDVHVNMLFANYTKFVKKQTFKPNDYVYPKWIITDVRFENEAERVLQEDGLLLRVESDYINVEGGKTKRIYPEGGLHASETSLDNYKKFHYVIPNNDSLEDLISSVKQVIQLEGI